MTVDELAKCYFKINTNEDIDLALFSLRVAIKSYFETYRSLKGRMNFFNENNHTEKEIENQHSFKYCLLCQETLIHFQHFFELSIKRALKKDHPMLSDNAVNNPVLFHKLIHGQKLTEDEINGLKSVEFSEALDRLCRLVEHEQLTDYQDYRFITDNKNALRRLNELRNKIWHKGLNVLYYTALDEFVCKYILPIVISMTELPMFKKHEVIWKFKKLSCGIDLIEMLIEESSSSKIDYGKMALLKELGRAAYENPLTMDDMPGILGTGFTRMLNADHINRAQRIATVEAESEYASVRNCPVCGLKTFIIFDEIDGDFEDDSNLANFSTKTKCECCSLEIGNDTKNPSEYGINSIADYWFFRKLN